MEVELPANERRAIVHGRPDAESSDDIPAAAFANKGSCRVVEAIGVQVWE